MDYPELRIDEHETTEMPFRYVAAEGGQPVMPVVSRLLGIRHFKTHSHGPQGMIDLIKKDADKGFADLL